MSETDSEKQEIEFLSGDLIFLFPFPVARGERDDGQLVRRRTHPGQAEEEAGKTN